MTLELAVDVRGEPFKALQHVRALGFSGAALCTHVESVTRDTLAALRPFVAGSEKSAQLAGTHLVAPYHDATTFAVSERVHLELHELADLNVLLAALKDPRAPLHAFQIISVSIHDASIFKAVLNLAQLPFDIVRIPTSVDLQILPKRSQITRLTALGAFVELHLSPLISCSNFFPIFAQRAMVYLRFLKSEFLLVSCGSDCLSTLRSPQELQYLLLLFGINSVEQRYSIVHRNPLLLLERAKIRCSGFAGTAKLAQ